MAAVVENMLIQKGMQVKNGYIEVGRRFRLGVKFLVGLKCFIHKYFPFVGEALFYRFY